MNAGDRRLAREALLRGRLTIEQITGLRREAEATGRPLARIAVERGLLAVSEAAPYLGPARPSALYPALLALSLAIFTGLLVATLLILGQRSRRDGERALESMESRAEAERLRRVVIQERQRALALRWEEDARAGLERARKVLRSAEELGPANAEAGRWALQALPAFDAWLDLHPDDAEALVARGRTHEISGGDERALRDLQRALELQPELEPRLRDRIAALRLRLRKG